jgi:hypothetical protein
MLVHGLAADSSVPRLRANCAFIHARFIQKAYHGFQVAALPGCEKIQETGFGHASASLCNERTPCSWAFLFILPAKEVRSPISPRFSFTNVRTFSPNTNLTLPGIDGRRFFLHPARLGL